MAARTCLKDDRQPGLAVMCAALGVGHDSRAGDRHGPDPKARLRTLPAEFTKTEAGHWLVSALAKCSSQRKQPPWPCTC